MDRDKLIGQAADYYLSHPNADFAVTMADFHIAMSAERDAENEKLWEALDKFRELLNRD